MATPLHTVARSYIVEIKCEEFTALLKRLHVGAFSGVTGVPIAKRFLFANGRAYGSSGSVCVIVPFPQWDQGDASVDGALLEKAVRGFSGDLAITVGTTFKVQCGSAIVELPLQEPYREFYPEPRGTWEKVTAEFPTMVAACAFSNKTDYAGVALKHVEGGSLLVGTDQSKIYYGFLPANIPEFWLNVDAASALGLVGGDCDSIAVDDMWVHAKFVDGTIFSALTMQADKYPAEDLYQYVVTFQDGEGDVCGDFTDAMRQAVKQASVFAGGVSGRKQVSFVYSAKKLSISSEGAGGSYKCSLDWDGGETGFAVTIDAQFILTAKPQKLKLLTSDGLTVLKVPGDVNALLALDTI